MPGGSEITDNGIIEKYCYQDELEACELYGGLYQWKEIMNYSTTPGVQGICPPEWHVPTNDDWKILKGVADTQYGIGDPEWDEIGIHGFDVGLNLRSTHGWPPSANGPDMVGFGVLPAGCWVDGIFMNEGTSTTFWTSNEYIPNYSWYNKVHANLDSLLYNFHYKGEGFSVRCVKDE